MSEFVIFLRSLATTPPSGPREILNHPPSLGSGSLSSLDICLVQPITSHFLTPGCLRDSGSLCIVLLVIAFSTEVYLQLDFGVLQWSKIDKILETQKNETKKQPPIERYYEETWTLSGRRPMTVFRCCCSQSRYETNSSITNGVEDTYLLLNRGVRWPN